MLRGPRQRRHSAPFAELEACHPSGKGTVGGRKAQCGTIASESPRQTDACSGRDAHSSPVVKVGFLADADLNKAIVTGILRREPSIGFLTAHVAGLRSIKDPEVQGWRQNSSVCSCHTTSALCRCSSGHSGTLESAALVYSLSGSHRRHRSGKTGLSGCHCEVGGSVGRRKLFRPHFPHPNPVLQNGGWRAFRAVFRNVTRNPKPVTVSLNGLLRLMRAHLGDNEICERKLKALAGAVSLPDR